MEVNGILFVALTALEITFKAAIIYGGPESLTLCNLRKHMQIGKLRKPISPICQHMHSIHNKVRKHNQMQKKMVVTHEVIEIGCP